MFTDAKFSLESNDEGDAYDPVPTVKEHRHERYQRVNIHLKLLEVKGVRTSS